MLDTSALILHTVYIMAIINKKEAFLLFFGDIILFYCALWLALLLRYGETPSFGVWSLHCAPFTILFLAWVTIFFIAGLYEKHTLVLRNNIPSILLRAQIINSAFAVFFFYFIPYFNIAPKTNLFIYLALSFIFVFLWRIFGVSALGFRRKQKAILIGSGDEIRELKDEVNNNSRYGLTFVSSVDINEVDGLDFEDDILDTIYGEDIKTIVIDLKNQKIETMLPRLYNLIFSHIRFIDNYRVYEDIFDRIPLSLVGYNWFLENISGLSHMGYDMLKRGMDIIISLIFGTVSLIVYPFVCVAIALEDGFPVFFKSERIGRHGHKIYLTKFRSMSTKSSGVGIENGQYVTRVGSFLRKARIDELPQLWNVFMGDISLVGPRPETPPLVKLYEREIPYYNVRHLIKPGLSGWAQIYHKEHPHHNVAVSETKRKLSYDLFYIKNRSFLLDIKIALKTIKTLLSRAGR